MSAYAGIGSRETPEDVLSAFVKLAAELSEQGHVLRSGGAPGADSAFQEGAYPNHEIFLPWPGFNEIDAGDAELIEPIEHAYLIAETFHPAWSRLGQGARRLHARNSHIILGADLQDPVEFVICWTFDGKVKGGTAQGIRIAEDSNIPIINFGKFWDGWNAKW